MALVSFFFVPSLKWWFGLSSQIHTKPWIGIAYIHSSYKMLTETYLKEYNKFEIRVVIHNLCGLIYTNEKVVFELL